MNTFPALLEMAVRQELRSGTPVSHLATPLLTMLARITVGVHNKNGSGLDDLVEVLRHQLDEAVAHYAAHNPASD